MGTWRARARRRLRRGAAVTRHVKAATHRDTRGRGTRAPPLRKPLAVQVERQRRVQVSVRRGRTGPCPRTKSANRFNRPWTVNEGLLRRRFTHWALLYSAPALYTRHERAKAVNAEPMRCLGSTSSWCSRAQFGGSRASSRSSQAGRTICWNASACSISRAYPSSLASPCGRPTS